MRIAEFGMARFVSAGNGIGWLVRLPLLLDVDRVVRNARLTLIASLSIRMVDRFSAAGFVG